MDKITGRNIHQSVFPTTAGSLQQRKTLPISGINNLRSTFHMSFLQSPTCVLLVCAPLTLHLHCGLSGTGVEPLGWCFTRLLKVFSKSNLRPDQFFLESSSHCTQKIISKHLLQTWIGSVSCSMQVPTCNDVKKKKKKLTMHSFILLSGGPKKIILTLAIIQFVIHYFSSWYFGTRDARKHFSIHWLSQE